MDAISLFRALEDRPHDFDFYQVMRQIECLFAEKPRIGEALRPADEPIRLGQQASMAFAPSPLAALEPATEGSPPRLLVNFFGLLGPNGPLPLHLTEYAHERLLHGGDATFVRFLDMLNHRYIEFLYRAWAQAQPTANLDRPTQDRFAVYVGALFGLAGDQLRARDEVSDYAKLFHAGTLGNQVRNREGLETLLGDYFQLPVRVEEFVGHWMELSPRECTRLGNHDDSALLGRSLVLGNRVWDCQSKVRLWFGPLTLEQFEGFLPGSAGLRRLVVWMRQFLNFELDWDVRLVLKPAEVPPWVLGGSARLGWTSWSGITRGRPQAASVTLEAERYSADERYQVH